jgi:hypothetical protein
MRGAMTLEIIAMMDSCNSPRYHDEVSPESEKPTVPSSVVTFSTTLSIDVMRVLGMITGFFRGVETGKHSTLMILVMSS